MKDIYEALDQIKKCKFKDEHGHPLENNVGFIFLEKFLFDEADEQEFKGNLNNN